MITKEQYFTHPRTGQVKPHPIEHEENFIIWRDREEALVNEAIDAGAFTRAIDPDTGCELSGARGGDGDGGYRARDSATGKPGGPHYDGRAGDRYDPGSRLNNWLDTFEDGHGGNRMLEKHGLYREHPDYTKGSSPDKSWCHTQIKPVPSGKRTFRPW